MRLSFPDADPIAEQLVELIRSGLDVDRFVVHTRPIAAISTQQLLTHERTLQLHDCADTSLAPLHGGPDGL